MASVPEMDLRRGCQSVDKLTSFFPTFAPDFFTIFKFQPEFFLGFQILSRKKIGPKNFAAKKSGRINFQSKNFWPKKISDRAGET